jgi:glucokinase
MNRLCFDIGGTFIKYGVVDIEGKILYKNKILTPKDNCKINIPNIICCQTKELKNKYTIDNIGISTAGQVDSSSGEIIFAADNIPGYTGTNFKAIVNDKLGMKCYVENDVNSAALGELWLGSGKGENSFLCITLGTGIGGAIIINKTLYKGAGGNAGELGHMIINENGEKCACSLNGCYERYASTSALVRAYAKAKEIDVEGINGQEVISKVISGDKIAIRVYDEFIDHVVSGLVGITHIIDPGLIIIGGGISEAGEMFLSEINKRFKKKVIASYSKYTRIVKAALGNDAGLIGACYITLHS